MASTPRVLVVTLALLLAGIIAGAICGALALLPLVFFPHHDTPVLPSLAIGAVIGGGVGALLGPVLSLGFLRGAPLWRVVCDPLLGAVLGSWLIWPLLVVSRFLGGYALESMIAAYELESMIAAALIGAAAATWRLRRPTRRPIGAAT